LADGHSSARLNTARTRFESRVLFRDQNEDAEEIATPTRRFSLFEITSGLPDDSREADERAAERRLRELRARVKAARAVVATTPGLAYTLQRDWRKAVEFYARFGILEDQFRHSAESINERSPEIINVALRLPSDSAGDGRGRTAGVSPTAKY
jgi:hypothetical protein